HWRPPTTEKHHSSTALRATQSPSLRGDVSTVVPPHAAAARSWPGRCRRTTNRGPLRPRTAYCHGPVTHHHARR
ncbi:hypothetical protein, partial [Austwickia sp. TVS 96-490-7B]|uniref:hypothetical protein n=1 Tax=Austwickia sp. TVS 96-490-7B TaxID=2830843 RepID=UPI001C594316